MKKPLTSDQKMPLNLLHHELETAASQWGDNVAIVTPERDYSFQQLDDTSSALAGALIELGVNQGDRLAILGHNSADYIIWHYAAAKTGVILHVLNTRLATTELQWMIDNAESTALIVDRDFVDQANLLENLCPSITFLIGMNGETTTEYDTGTLIEKDLLLTQPLQLDHHSPALMIYTSGTTGRPKGALQSHAGSLMADQLTRDAVKITNSDTYLALMPFFHQAGLIRTRATILAGGRCIILGKVEAAETANAIVHYDVTFTMIASPQQNVAIRNKLKEDGPEGFKNLRILLGGGGVGERATQTIKAICDALSCSYFGVYGQTETTGPAVYITGEDVFERPKSCGKPFPGVDIAICDDEGETLEAQSIGEINVRGPITAKYWRNEEANVALYEGEWIHTGDIGYLDDDGFLYFKGRVKELIKTGAENVYPREVEAVLEQHPDIADVAVIGLSDKDWGEVVCAVIVCRNNRKPSLTEVRDFCRNKIGGYKIPKRIFICENIPRNHTGKILRQPLIESALKENL
jgi:acyl-CoA synthetase (AMP-forming)/AMP-acid ligase II